MEEIIPQDEWVAVIEPFCYPDQKKTMHNTGYQKAAANVSAAMLVQFVK